MLKSLTKDYWDKIWKNRPDHLRSKFGYNLVETPKGKVLEIGCGDLSYSGLPFEAEYFCGVDISPEGLKRCKNTIKSLKGQKYLVAASALDLPFKDNSFDESFAFEFLHVLGRNYFKALEEMKRVTKKRITFTLEHKDIAELTYPLPKENLEDCTIFVHENCNLVTFTERNVEDILRELNLEIEELKVFTNRGAAQTNVYNLEQEVFVEHPQIKSRFFIRTRKK